MLFSHLSKFVSHKNNPKIVRTVTWLLRLIIGGVFIFSGFTKAIDPWGTIYKITDYIGALSFSIEPNIVIVSAFSLCAFEFILGVFLFLGSFRKSSAILSLAFMFVMLLLTLWIAITNPVADCGCFGDAIKLSNWATFWKNVALIIGVIWLVKFNTICKPLIAPSIQWIAMLSTFAYIVTIELVGFFYQPLMDFRQYKIGTSLISESTGDSTPEYLFTYKKQDILKDFTVDNLPDENDGWEFIDRKEIIKDLKDDNTKGSFHIWENGNEITEEVLDDHLLKNKMLLLLMPKLEEVSIAQTWKINSLHDWATSHNIKMIAIVSGSDDDIENWKDLSMPDYPIYTADDTEIKELVRGNPAVVFLQNGIIEWKSTLRAIDTDDFMSPETSEDPMSFAFDSRKGLANISWIYISIMALLVMSTIAFRLKQIVPIRRKLHNT